MSDSCVVLLLDCLIGAVVGIGIIACFWRLRRPLRWAQTYDAYVDEEGLYKGLPIYRFLRHYLLVMLLAGFVALTASTIGLISNLLGSLKVDDFACPKPGEQIVSLILVLFGIHMTTIICFETSRRRSLVPRIKEIVDEVRRRLWGVTAVLLIAIGLYSLSSGARSIGLSG